VKQQKIEFCNLFSGSSGNCSLVKTKHTKILIDCGSSGKKIEESIHSIDEHLEDIDAILVTHEHVDHVQSLGLISSKYNIPVYANQETWNAMPKQSSKIDDENKLLFIPNESFIINDILIEPFSIPHDAANPCAFNFIAGDKKMSIATDLGHITDDIYNKLKGSLFALIESNYDTEILKVSRYPFSLKRRISGPNGHLSNTNSAELICKLIKDDLKQVMLGHLSKENNFPELAYQTAAEAMMNSNIDMNEISLSVANRIKSSEIIKI